MAVYSRAQVAGDKLFNSASNLPSSIPALQATKRRVKAGRISAGWSTN